MLTIPWRTVECKEEIKCEAEFGDFGPTNWHLKIQTNKENLIVETTPNNILPQLSENIRDIENYLNLVQAKKKSIQLPENEILSAFWVDIVTSAYENNLPIQADVAKILPLPLDIKNVKVEPKKDTSCNFWVGSYDTGDYPNKSIFRLSSYDMEKHGLMPAKSSTKYIDFHPVDDRDIIFNILRKAETVYLPDIKTIGDIRSIQNNLQ